MEQQTPREPRRAGRSQRRGGARPAGADAAPLNFTGWGVAAVTKIEQTFHKENPGFPLCCQHFFHVVLFEMFLIVSRGRGARPQAAHSRREPPPRAPGRSLQNAGASAGQGGAGRGAGRSQRRGRSAARILRSAPGWGGGARGGARRPGWRLPAPSVCIGLSLLFSGQTKKGGACRTPPASVIGKAYHADALPLKRRERSGRTPALPYPLRGAKADFIMIPRLVPSK